MDGPIPVQLVVEDPLSEAVVRRLLQDLPIAIGACYGRQGFGYIRKKIGAFNHAAKVCPFLVLTDLDTRECAAALIREWLPQHRHPNLLFRVAVREVESWLLADPAGLAAFLGIASRIIPTDPDSLDDPKRTLIDLTRTSRKRDLREAIVPRPGSTAAIGPDYNGALAGFVAQNWNPVEAGRRSDSLRRFRIAVESFRPRWP
jgi:hypothetical protein